MSDVEDDVDVVVEEAAASESTINNTQNTKNILGDEHAADDAAYVPEEESMASEEAWLQRVFTRESELTREQGGMLLQLLQRNNLLPASAKLIPPVDTSQLSASNWRAFAVANRATHEKGTTLNQVSVNKDIKVPVPVLADLDWNSKMRFLSEYHHAYHSVKTAIQGFSEDKLKQLAAASYFDTLKLGTNAEVRVKQLKKMDIASEVMQAVLTWPMMVSTKAKYQIQCLLGQMPLEYATDEQIAGVVFDKTAGLADSTELERKLLDFAPLKFTSYGAEAVKSVVLGRISDFQKEIIESQMRGGVQPRSRVILSYLLGGFPFVMRRYVVKRLTEAEDAKTTVELFSEITKRLEAIPVSLVNDSCFNTCAQYILSLAREIGEITVDHPAFLLPDSVEYGGSSSTVDITLRYFKSDQMFARVKDLLKDTSQHRQGLSLPDEGKKPRSTLPFKSEGKKREQKTKRENPEGLKRKKESKSTGDEESPSKKTKLDSAKLVRCILCTRDGVKDDTAAHKAFQCTRSCYCGKKPSKEHDPFKCSENPMVKGTTDKTDNKSSTKTTKNGKSADKGK
jgi:hypothetical protein